MSTKQLHKQLRRAERAFECAVRAFELQPGFAETQLWLRDRMEEAEQQGAAESRYFGTEARAELALKWFDIRAEAFARLVTSIDTQNAFITMLARFQREAWRDFTGHYPEVMQPVSKEFVEIAEEIHRRAQGRIREGYKRLATFQKPPLRVGPSAQECRSSGSARWEDTEILFLSDERVQIRRGNETQTYNYGELGLQDRRSGKPKRAWLLLRILAQSGGTIKDTADTRGQWKIVERRIKELRKAFRQHFGISRDPLPFVRGRGYCSRIRIGCAPCFPT